MNTVADIIAGSIAPLLDTIIAVALVGTERRTPELQQINNAVAKVLTRLNERSDEGWLLTAAAVACTWRRTGRIVSHTSVPIPSEQPQDVRPRCSRNAAIHLAIILQSEHIALLPEWLTLIAERNERPPEEMLPALLDRGIKNHDLRPSLARAIGARGAWLAGLNPAWSYAANSTIAIDTWEYGEKRERLDLLRQLRASNPAEARELLASTWTQESGSERAELVATFATGLSMADEKFLETALDDRRLEVRQEAIGLLGALPDSAFVSRMIERVAGLVRYNKGEGRIELTPVELTAETVTPQMERDGLRCPPVINDKVRSGWTIAVVAAIPLHYWSRTLKQPVARLAEAAFAGNATEELITGWTIAARQQHNSEWGEELITERIKITGDDGRSLPEETLLPTDLSAEFRERVAIKLLSSSPPSYNGWGVWMLRNSHRQWSHNLSRAVIQGIIAVIRSDQTNVWQWIGFLDYAARQIDPRVLDEAVALADELSQDQSHWISVIDKFIATLRFRRELRMADYNRQTARR